MARWQLMEPHYLLSPGVVWEEMSTDRTTGRAKRKSHPVPLHLDPKNSGDWTHKTGIDVTRGGNEFAEGVIVVCWEGKGEPQDIPFIGKPTPGMMPIDDEAKAESAKYKWSDPIAEFDMGMSYSEKLLVDLQTQVANALTAKNSISDSSHGNADILAMQKQMSDMMAMMSQSMSMIAQSLEKLTPARRV